MRLAVASPFVDRRHGTERSLAELLERLAGSYNCEIHLYSQRVEDLAIGHSASLAVQECPGIIWHRVPSIPGPYLWQFLFWMFLNDFCRRWDRAIHGMNFDLVLSPGVNCFDADVVTVHALFHRLRDLAREWQSESAMSGFFRRSHRRAYYALLTFLERHIYGRSNVSLAAVSWRTATLLKGLFHREDVRVIPNGVNTEQFSPLKRLALRNGARARYNFSESDFVILLVGNDWRNKGLSTILAAMVACPEIPIRLLVAGGDAAASFFVAAAKELGLSEQCRWEAASVDTIDLYAAADAYVSPTREDAFALPPLEAMACGLPIITSVNNGGSQIISQGVDGFVLSDPADATSLARYLKDLQGQTELRLRMGDAARQTAQAYTWDRNAAAVWEYLKEACGKKAQAHR